MEELDTIFLCASAQISGMVKFMLWLCYSILTNLAIDVLEKINLVINFNICAYFFDLQVKEKDLE